MVLTQSLADLDMIYGKDERKAMLGNFKFTVLLGCKDTETQEYFQNDRRKTLSLGNGFQRQAPADNQARRPCTSGAGLVCDLR